MKIAMPVNPNTVLYQTLQELAVIAEKELVAAQKLADSSNQPLSEILVEKDLLSDEQLGQVIANMYDLPFVHLSNKSIDESVLNLIPEIVARNQQIVAFEKKQQGLSVAMVDPTNVQIVNFLQKKIGLPINVHVTTSRELSKTLNLYLKHLTIAYQELMQQKVDTALHKQQDTVPIIDLVQTILFYAHTNRVSDIHIEPQVKTSSIRFRIDGVLHDMIEIDKSLHERIVSRIKVMARMRTDEHQAAQDGRFSWKPKDTGKGSVSSLHIRTSIIPITTGQKVVLRLLSESSRQFSLADLGFSQHDYSLVKTVFTKPHGLILSVGPTGSGKTTTLYALLKRLNRREVNIATIEDPVEYDMPGVNQIQVNPKTNLTFAAGLRSIVRQDPDIILVGEIRDEETAKIAVQSAMTGHLVLSTLHTNDAVTAIPRLIELGVEPFLLISTLQIVVSQRLVRQIHQSCRVSTTIKREQLENRLQPQTLKKLFGTKKTLRMYSGKGCPACHNTGYDDRLGLFEVLPITEELKEAIVRGDDTTVLTKLAQEQGMHTLLDDGIEKVIAGETTLEEVLRVVEG
jgi:type IV pilus assembly protein PilB